MKHLLKYVAICVIIVLIVSTVYLKNREHSAPHPYSDSGPTPHDNTGQWIHTPPATALSDPAAGAGVGLDPGFGSSDGAGFSNMSHFNTPAPLPSYAPQAPQAPPPARSRPDSIAQHLSRIEAAPPATTDYMTTVIGDMPRVSESFSITLPDADQPDIVSELAVTDDLKHQHKAYLKRNAGKFLIASQRGLVEDVDVVPQYGLRSYKCSQIQEDPNSRQVSSLDSKTTFCRDRAYSASEYQG